MSSWRENYARPPAVDISELLEFDWLNHHSTNSRPCYKPEFYSIMDIRDESMVERQLRMLRPLATTCLACSMCELGRQPAERNGIARDPHVFSNMKPSPIVVIGQNPGWEELKASQPFVGAAGKNFDIELKKNGLSRDDFYICNTVRCFTTNNERPTVEHKERCEPFLRMELQLLRPKMVVTLGAVAFSQFCPDAEFSSSLKKLTKSKKYGVQVFAVYHPSPMNFQDESRRDAFVDQMRVMCAVAKKLLSSPSTVPSHHSPDS